MYKYFYSFIILGLFLGLGSIADAQSFTQGEACPASQQLTQNLTTGSYNGEYHAYTKGIVSEAHILQGHLNRLGFSSGKEDGKLGPISDGAIKRMQTYLGLAKIDGIVGPNTRAALNNSCGTQEVVTPTVTPTTTPVANTSSTSRIANIQAELARLAGMIALTKTSTEVTTPQSEELAKEQIALIEKQIKEVGKEVERSGNSQSSESILSQIGSAASGNDAKIYWNQKSRVNSYIKFGTSETNLNQFSELASFSIYSPNALYSLNSSNNLYRYGVKLGNLQSGTTYYYQVVVEKMSQNNIGIGNGDILQISETKEFVTDSEEVTPTPAQFPPEVNINSTNWGTYSLPTGGEPADYLVPFTDALNGLKVTRVGDQDEFGVTNQRVRHNYSLDSVWNTDQTLIKLSGYPAAILDGDTYELRTDMGDDGWANIAGYGRWSNTNPYYIYGTSENKFQRTDVRTNQRTTVRTFSGYSSVSFGSGEGNLDNNDEYVALIGTRSGGKDIIVYDIQDNQIHATQALPNSGTLDWVSISPSGEYVVVSWKDSGTGVSQGFKIYDTDLTNYRHLNNYTEHGDMGYNQAGDEVLVQFASGNLHSQNYYMTMIRLSDGQETPLFYDQTGPQRGIWGGHISLRNVDRPGWAYVTEGCCSSNNVVGNEIFALKLDSSNMIERFGKSHSKRIYDENRAYLHEQQGSVSRDGTKIMFASNYNDPEFINWNAPPAWIIELQ